MKRAFFSLFAGILIFHRDRSALPGRWRTTSTRCCTISCLAGRRWGLRSADWGKRGDSKVIYRENATSPLIPASNLKVITTSAALEKLGAGFKFQTRLYWHNGDLVLIGDGDPTLGDAEMLKKVGWDVDTVFKTWAGGLAKRGVISAR